MNIKNSNLNMWNILYNMLNRRLNRKGQRRITRCTPR